MDSGQLGPGGAAEVLHGYAAAGATGCLRFERERLQTRVYYRDGMVYAAAAPGARTRLGDRLVGAGHVAEEELATTLAHQQTLREPRRIGELLIERGLIDRETVRAFVREQSTDSVAVALGWQEGTWTFTPDEEIAEDIPLDMSVENLVMEGARRLEEWEVIQRRIGSVEAVPDFAPREDTAELALTPDEWSMLTRIDGQASIADIAAEAGYSEFEAGRIIYGLLTAGVVSLVDDGAQAGTDAGAQTSPEGADFDPDEASQLFGELGLDEPGAGAADASADPGDEPDADPGDEPDADPWELADLEETAAASSGHGAAAGGEEPSPPGGEPASDAPTSADAAPEPDAEAPRSGAGGQVSRNELFREFAALDDPAAGEPGQSVPQAPPPRATPPPPRRSPDEDKDKGKRKGLFGRRKRG